MTRITLRQRGEIAQCLTSAERSIRQTGPKSDAAINMVIRSTGQIVRLTQMYLYNTNAGSSAVTQLNSDGTLDTSFGSSGTYYYTGGSDDIANRMFEGGRIEQLSRECGHVWGDSPLGPAETVVMFMRQVIAGSEVSPQAYCKARRRLPLGVLHGLFGDLHDRLLPETKADDHLWHGHRVLLIDGSSFSTPDTPELRGHFGTATGQAPGCGFPVAYLLVLFCASTGLLLNFWATTAR